SQASGPMKTTGSWKRFTRNGRTIIGEKIWRVRASEAVDAGSDDQGARIDQISAEGGEEVTMMIHGTVHGTTIELDENPGLAEGQEVTVQVTPIPPVGTLGQGLLRCAGALANDTEWDAIMEEI